MDAAHHPVTGPLFSRREMLRQAGLGNHRQLTYLFQGRQQRLTDVGGDREFADKLLA
jgi:hypothetical protein